MAQSRSKKFKVTRHWWVGRCMPFSWLIYSHGCNNVGLGIYEDIKSVLGDGALGRKNVKVHALPKGILTLYLIYLTIRVHVKVITHILLSYLTPTVVWCQVPIRVRPIIPHSNAVTELTKSEVCFVLFETSTDHWLVWFLDIIELRIFVTILHFL